MYRKTTIAKVKTLTYLDDRPVFEEDRRHAEAYNRGGIDAERAERDIMRAERDAKQLKQHTDFKNMMRKAREEKRAADEAKAKAQAEAKGETWEAPKPADVTEENVSPNYPDSNGEVEEPQIYEVEEDVNDVPPELE